MENMEPIATEAEAGSPPGPRPAEEPAGPQDWEAIKPPQGLKAKDLIEAGLMEPSDVEGLKQLLFHVGCAVVCGLVVSWSVAAKQWAIFVLAELCFALVSSFYFNGFHECVHNTAFRSKHLNNAVAHVVGFLTLRGATWFWCFHWTHHRYTNDATLDPELSGGSLDLEDPTKSLKGYFSFLSGYPFGFERVWGMVQMAQGLREDPWVANKQPKTQRMVRLESAVYVSLYSLLALASLLQPLWGPGAGWSSGFSLGQALLLYWLLPHCLGAGHLRMYQFAEHRACQMGPYTDTNAWICARTTATWALYAKLAWYMPYHIEHHSWPNCPFHKLKEVHGKVRQAYELEGIGPRLPSGCDPSGEDGYLVIHYVTFRRMLSNVFGVKEVNSLEEGTQTVPLLKETR